MPVSKHSGWTRSVNAPVSLSSRPLSPYAASKKAAETLLYSYHHLYGRGSDVDHVDVIGREAVEGRQVEPYVAGCGEAPPKPNRTALPGALAL